MPEDEERVPKDTKRQKTETDRVHQRQMNLASSQECLPERMRGRHNLVGIKEREGCEAVTQMCRTPHCALARRVGTRTWPWFVCGACLLQRDNLPGNNSTLRNLPVLPEQRRRKPTPALLPGVLCSTSIHCQELPAHLLTHSLFAFKKVSTVCLTECDLAPCEEGAVPQHSRQATISDLSTR